MESPPHSGSSSGNNDDEYDSPRAADSIAAFLDAPQPPSSAAFFESDLSSYFHPQSPQPQNHNLNLDWFKALNSSAASTTSVFSSLPLEAELCAASQMPAKNPKKRSRASRRAPTTVLTTDTSNFRSMVQEFTGIPAPPFSNRSRLDLFAGAPSPVLQQNPFCETPPYNLLRPFPQKRQHMAFDNDNTSPIQYPLIHQNTNSSDLVNPQTHNPIFTFQSLLQSNTPPNHGLINGGYLLEQESPTVAVASSLDMNPNPTPSSEKEAVCARSEGLVESWICSSE